MPYGTEIDTPEGTRGGKRFDDSEHMREARERFAQAKSFWSEVRDDYQTDNRLCSGRPGSQWDADVKARRDSDGRPALEFNELNVMVQESSNKIRADLPSPQVEPADDDAQPETAEMLEGRIRHDEYESQSGMAYTHAIQCAMTGGMGFYEITTEYVCDEPTADWNKQEPRIKRILDPMSVLYIDPNVKEPDFSDAKWWFQVERMTRKDFKRRFHTDPIDFDAGDQEMQQWNDTETVQVAKYWQVHEKQRIMLQLKSGAIGYQDELDYEDDEVYAWREVDDREVVCELIDGGRTLEEYDWLGDWIPIIPVLGREVIVDGRRQFISMVRFARDPQRLLNAYQSGIAGGIGITSLPPWLGYKGQFKDPKWRLANRQNFAYLESEIVTLPSGETAPLPQHNSFEPPIQALSAGALQQQDIMRRIMGYADAAIEPSKQKELSGVAIMRRMSQQEMANFHFAYNLEYSQWHCGRQLVQLEMRLADTPRALRTRSVDGKNGVAPVTARQGDGSMPEVPGHEGKPHHRMDVGRYGVVIESGPSYATKRDAERETLNQLIAANPQLLMVFGDVWFELMGYPELAERAKLALAPNIQQAMSMKEGQMTPAQMQQQLVATMQENATLKQGLQKLLNILQTKQVEAAGRLAVENAKTAGNLAVEHAKAVRELGVQAGEHRHDATKAMLDAGHNAIELVTKLLHESEMTPDPMELAKVKASKKSDVQ